MFQRRNTILSVSLVSGVALFLAAQGVAHSVIFAPIFQVKEMEVQWPQEMKRPIERYRLVPATSIFLLDLGNVSQVLGYRYPVAEVEAVRRILPNRIVATLRPRTVLAQVRADRYYPVADEGTIVAAGQPGPWPHLPIVTLDDVKGPFRVGDTIGRPSFWRISELLAAIRRQGGINGHGASHVKTRKGDLILLLDSGVEIRFDADHLESGWLHLMELAAQRGDVLDQARYLDFRFEDPVIGRDEKNAAHRRP